MTNPNIPPEIADATPAPAPVRISQEVRETIDRSLRQSRARLDARAWELIGVDRSIVRGEIEQVEAAIAFVEALP